MGKVVHDYLIEFDRGLRCPAHLLADHTCEVPDLGCSEDVRFGNAKKSLLLDVEVFEEDHDVLGCRLRLGRVRNHVKVKAKVHLTNCHLVADDIDG